tara:strand:- start:1724 stop:2419 length:696 start_codon:yes stop_codon:yes gene_type:complete
LGLIGICPNELKYDVVRKLTFAAALAGLHPFAGNLVSIAIDSQRHLLKVVTKNGATSEIKYEKLRIFNPEGVSGIPAGTNDRTVDYSVYDWFDVRSGTKHDLMSLEDSDTLFVNKIHFYLSERIDGNTMYKDLVAESILSKEQLHHPDYSDSLSRLKTIAMMKESGIKGTANGGSQYLPIKLELYQREVIPNKIFDFIHKEDIIVDNRTGERVVNEWISSCRDSADSRSAA